MSAWLKKISQREFVLSEEFQDGGYCELQLFILMKNIPMVNLFLLFPLKIKYEQMNCGHFQMKLKTNLSLYIRTKVFACKQTKYLHVSVFHYIFIRIPQDITASCSGRKKVGVTELGNNESKENKY